MNADQALRTVLKDLQAKRSEYTRLRAIQADQEKQRDALKTVLDDLTFDRGVRVLASIQGGAGEETARELSRAVAEKRSEIETTDAVLTVIKPQIETARRAVIQAKGAAFLAEAAICAAQADERRSKTDDLLRQLQEFEGVEYGPVQPDLTESYFGNQGERVHVVAIPTPITVRLRQQAEYYRLCAGLTTDEKPFPVSVYDGKPPFPLPVWYQD